MSRDKITISGLGMVSPVGLNAAQSCAAVRAGISLFKECDDFECEPEELDWSEPEPAIGARAPESCFAPSGLELPQSRITALLLQAIQDLIRNSGMSRNEFARANVYIAVPAADRTGLAEGLPVEELRAFFSSAIKPFFGELKFFPGPSGAFFSAFAQAADRLSQDRDAAFVVAGVDSYHDFNTLSWLDRLGRFKSGRNRDGFVPGEAAAAVLLKAGVTAEAGAGKPLAIVEGLGLASEKNVIGSGCHSTAAGLSEAILMAAGSNGSAPAFQWAACDLNGESYRSMEWGLCQVRLSGYFSGLKQVWHPADCMGDIGAASGAALTVLAARAFEKSYAPADKCLIFCSSDDGARAALVLAKP